MVQALAERLRRALDDPDVRGCSPVDVDRLATAVARPDQAREAAVATPHGGIVCFLPARAGGPKRRVLELDRNGSPVAALRWGENDTLASALVRSSHGDWIGVEARAASHEVWGLSDRLWRLPEGPSWRSRARLTVFEAVDWASISRIPPLAEPARLPQGAGTAVLNLIAALAADQRVDRLPYRGPYATEALFTALLESFRFVPGVADPLRRFLAGALDWAPAPHERHFPSPDLCVQLRSAVEKVVLRGRAYYREEWQSIRRHAPRRVREAGSVLPCSLWALDAVIEDHLVLDREGNVIAMLEPAPDPRPPGPVSPPVRAGLDALIRATSAPALDRQIRETIATLAIEWGGVTGDLTEIDGPRARFSCRLKDVGAARIRAAASQAERLGAALALLTEMARLIGDAVRARAQSALAALPVEDQSTALKRDSPADDSAALIAGAAGALAEELGH